MKPYNTEIIDAHLPGWKLKVKFYYDSDMGAPWEEHDGHGTVRSARSNSHYVRGTGKAAGEVVIHDSQGTLWYYDFKGAVKTARKDPWGLSEEALQQLKERLAQKLVPGRAIDPGWLTKVGALAETITPTRGQIAVAAVQADMKYLRGWLRDDWHWCGMRVTIESCPPGYEPFLGNREDSCWGFDSGSDNYLTESAQDMGRGLISSVLESKESADKVEAVRQEVVTAAMRHIRLSDLSDLDFQFRLTSDAAVVDGWVQAWVRIP